MKKDRNCGGNMYPNYQMNGMMPMQGGMPPMPYPAPMPGPMNNYPMMGMQQFNSNDNTINQLQNQIDSLERRVNRLEQMLQNDKFTNSPNYQMM